MTLFFIRGIPVLQDRTYLDATEWLSTGFTNDLVSLNGLPSVRIENFFGFDDASVDSQFVPEPGALTLAGLSFIGWFGFRRRQQ
ncbi:MAG: PEP-CTERM sorting domain-containing protein [Pirellulales bacterium]